MINLKRDTLEFMLGVSRELHPKEFIGLLRSDGEVIKEVIVLPGTVHGEGFAFYKPHMMPIDKSIVGSVHSHPSSNPMPSKTDLVSFGKKGWVHLILSYPFKDARDVSAYDSRGLPADFTVVD